jgi:hypothetical protein
VGFFARDDEVPYWMHLWNFVNDTVFLWLPMLIAGIIFVAIGNTLGRVIGGVLLVGGALWAAAELRSLRRRRDEA